MKRNRPARYIEGKISITSRGTGYLEAEGFREDIEIPASLLNTALDGDRVRILLLPRQRKAGRRPSGLFARRPGKRQTGQVIKIIKRAKTDFVGTVEFERGECFVRPDDKKMYADLLIPRQEAKREPLLKPGYKVLVQMLPWRDPRKNPEARLKKIIGPAGEHSTEVLAIALDSGFIYEFSSESERQAQEAKRKFKEIIRQEESRRRDFRGIPTFTIDPETAKDFDDAISFRQLHAPRDTLPIYEVGVHIADVSFFVQPNSPLDRDASDKATSVYLVDLTIPMLPEALSADICSLLPNEDRLTFSAVFKINAEGVVLDRWFGRTIIGSQRRFTYRQAQDILDKGAGQFYQELKILDQIALKLRRKRIEKGAIIFDTSEVEVKLDNLNRPVEIKVKERLETMKMIEDWMLLANREVATFGAVGPRGHHRPFLFRVHEEPDPERIIELAIFVRGLGHHLPEKHGRVRAQDLERLFSKLEKEKRPEAGLIEYAALRSMAKAKYSTRNEGHFGLGFRYYTHFTSPIRRYPDIISHRLLDTYLRGGRIPPQMLGQIESLAQHSTEREIEADKASRDSIKLKQVEYMSTRIGQTFEGIITSVTEWGFYVQEKKTLSEGLIHISKLGDDYYELDLKQYAIIGEKTRARWSLGDSVKIKVASTNLADRRIDYELAS